ncbi:MAG TPA: prepilin-type N-terminal cleavage/methylation domain-containing protein [Candidatus Omnitrophota bacterium]|nr:prepilin-type N-terminal cleavage/methylation domain-containing protein [Candidatus Omnitrophota bacterium]
MKNRKFGFTLIEIMIVVFIVSLLLSIVALEGIKLRRTANEMNAQANLKGIATSFEVYAAGHTGTYAQTNEANMQFLVDAKYATQDFITLGQIANFRYIVGLIEPAGYDIRAMAVNPVLAEHNYQIITGAKILRSDTSVSSDTDFKSF